MARPPSVFVRDLSPEEATRLRRISRQSKVFALRQRAQILLASDSQVAAPEIARVLQTDENQVRRVIAEFNTDGMDSLRPPTGGGHPRRIDNDTREAIRAIALARPCDLGEPGTRWSLSAPAPLPDPPSGAALDLQGAPAPPIEQDGHHRPADPHLEVVQRPALRTEEAVGAGRLQSSRGRHPRRGAGQFRRVRTHLPQAAPGPGLVRHQAPRPASGPPTRRTKALASCWAPTTWAPTVSGVDSRPAR